jgi:hypothetical protein
MKTILYTHPDGYQISFDGLLNVLHITDGEMEINLPIGPIGLTELGSMLIFMGFDGDVK